MTAQQLVEIMMPPQNPVDSGPGKVWPAIEDGLPFPSDYRWFINNYGSGRVADFFMLFNPLSSIPNVNFFNQSRLILEDLNELNQCDPDLYSYPIFPAPDGLIPIGVTDNGDYICWLTNSKADSDSWGIAIITSRSPDIEYFQSNLTSVLAGLLSGVMKSNSLPDLIAVGGIRFDVL
jgi:hypothetical protein